MSSFGNLWNTIGLRIGGSPILSLFSAGEQGLWLDPSDLSTLFQDTAGTIPVTAAGQQIALMLDKSGRGNHFVQPTALARPTLQTDGLGHWFLEFDGVDDFMAGVGTLDLSASDKMTVWLGLRKYSDSAICVVFETAPNGLTSNGSLWMLAPGVPGQATFAVGGRGAGAAGGLRGTPFAAPMSAVFTAIADIGQSALAGELSIRINGSPPPTIVYEGAPLGTGNFGNWRPYLGMRGGTGYPFKGAFYGVVARGGASNGETIAAVEPFIADKMGLPAPVITVTSGSGYAGSTLTADKAPGQWFANGVAIAGATDQALAITLDLEEADITYKWLGLSSLPFRMWTPARAGITSVFDARRLSALSTDWQSADGVVRYVQPNAPTRPVYEADGLGGSPCMFSDWNRAWVIEGLPPAPGARTLIGLFSFLTTDPANSFLQIINTQPGAWTIRKSYLSGGKRSFTILRSPNSDGQESPYGFSDNAPCIASLKTKRPSGDYGFRLNGASLASGVSAGVNSFVDNGGTYTMGGYIRLGSHAYADSYMTLSDEIDFEGWCAWTSGQQGLLAADHPRKAVPLRIS